MPIPAEQSAQNRSDEHTVDTQPHDTALDPLVEDPPSSARSTRMAPARSARPPRESTETSGTVSRRSAALSSK